MHIQQYGARTVIGCTDKNDQTVLHYAACVGNVLVRIAPTCIACLFQPSHRVCKLAYLMPVPSQDKLGGFWQEEYLAIFDQ